ncbi:MAG: BTAD domain-containing putative transcriptional regulator [Dehalococcoidia bacterium]|nr:BTAD domain-containing putative transcriptional regulator [Dehalococcoidia bacterium]
MLDEGTRVYLTGRVAIESPHGRVDQGKFPGRQGRLAFAQLALRDAPVPRSELIELLWAGEPPSSADTALSAIISRLRTLLRDAGLPRGILVSALGCYELRLAPGTWIDVRAAAQAVHDAEAALQAGDARVAYGPASVAYHIARRPFLPGEDGSWVDEQRTHLLALLSRATECLAMVSLNNGEPGIAVALAEELLGRDPFREIGYQILMRAHLAAGSRAEALRAYERCRLLLAEELGADPSPETQALHLQVLTGS